MCVFVCVCLWVCVFVCLCVWAAKQQWTRPVSVMTFLARATGWGGVVLYLLSRTASWCCFCIINHIITWLLILLTQYIWEGNTELLWVDRSCWSTSSLTDGQILSYPCISPSRISRGFLWLLQQKMPDFASAFLKNFNTIWNVLCALIAVKLQELGKLQAKENVFCFFFTTSEELYVIIPFDKSILHITETTIFKVSPQH